ncbi:MAG: metallophosphoesterase [Pyrinomonadaceae bacterium]|nr:metallophosphoesterase [Sphingobacteriaceae bacterium]
MNFTIIILPDTQHYTTNNTDTTYKSQVKWIIRNKEAKNIKHVIHLGDITQHNLPNEWSIADHAHGLLDNANVPYSIIPGNHDSPGATDFRKTEAFNKYFGPHRFKDKSWYGGHMDDTNDNNYSFFSQDNLKFLVIALEFAPRRKALDWANQIITTHRDHRVIIVTHCYQGNGGDHYDCSATTKDGTSGWTIWRNLVSTNKNVFLVLSGHVNDSEYNMRLGILSNPVHEILTNYQSELKDAKQSFNRDMGEVEWLGKRHGNGWMRSLTFIPDSNLIHVETFTVIDGIDSLNILDKSYGLKGAYSSNRQNKDHKYSFLYDMKGSNK